MLKMMIEGALDLLAKIMFYAEDNAYWLRWTIDMELLRLTNHKAYEEAVEDYFMNV